MHHRSGLRDLPDALAVVFEVLDSSGGVLRNDHSLIGRGVGGRGGSPGVNSSSLIAALCWCEHRAARSKSPSAAVCSSIAATWQLLKKGNYLAQISSLRNIAVRSGHYGKMMLQADA